MVKPAESNGGSSILRHIQTAVLGAHTLIGAIQSVHCRLTLAAEAKEELKCRLIKVMSP